MRFNVSPPRVEPLNPRTWEQIESELFQRLSEEKLHSPPEVPSFHGLSLGFASVSLAASLFAVLYVLVADLQPAQDITHLPQPQPEPSATREVAAERLSPAPVEKASHAEGPLQLVTLSDPLTHRLGESELVVAPRSQLTVRGSDESGWNVALEAGSAHFTVAPRLDRPDFLVRTPSVRVRVVGTQFRVSHSERAGSQVSVDEGKVLVERGESVTVLGPGDVWKQPESVRSRRRSTVRKTSRVRRRTRTIVRQRTSRHSSAEDFHRASSWEVEQPQRALQLYEKLASGSGEWAAPALYAQGRLLFDRGRHTRARAALEEYQKRFPHGVNMPDVDELLERMATTEP